MDFNGFRWFQPASRGKSEASHVVLGTYEGTVLVLARHLVLDRPNMYLAWHLVALVFGCTLQLSQIAGCAPLSISKLVRKTDNRLSGGLVPLIIRKPTVEG